MILIVSNFTLNIRQIRIFPIFVQIIILNTFSLYNLYKVYGYSIIAINSDLYYNSIVIKDFLTGQIILGLTLFVIYFIIANIVLMKYYISKYYVNKYIYSQKDLKYLYRALLNRTPLEELALHNLKILVMIRDNSEVNTAILDNLIEAYEKCTPSRYKLNPIIWSRFFTYNYILGPKYVKVKHWKVLSFKTQFALMDLVRKFKSDFVKHQ